MPILICPVQPQPITGPGACPQKDKIEKINKRETYFSLFMADAKLEQMADAQLEQKASSHLSNPAPTHFEPRGPGPKNIKYEKMFE